MKVGTPHPNPTLVRRRRRLDPDDSPRKAPKDRVSRPTRVSKPHLNHTAPVASRRKPRSSGPTWEDNRQLAADPTVVLPSDRGICTPQLKRQEAFREPKYYSDIVENDADLYKMGLLYDDEHVRGSYFDLDAIVHSEPVYSIRPAKRAKKQRQDSSYLQLEFSFASLGSDSDLQHYLAPEVIEIAPSAEDLDVPTLRDTRHRATITAPARSYRDAALSVIHELPESSAYPFDTAAPEAPDLISDSEIDDEEVKEEAQDWAVLDKTDIFDNTDVNVDAIDAASTTDEPWIVLGDGS
ncbi:uncharacterized protein F4822DRAFT_373006 [Hypoxylon trugodes]|uniref:uncharacterized protein n=1 Tax=Hypoxylon trugodes TaxID=326681 RepID=UPI0021A056AD|nr:uncharacterized protein F4822DRAFT_373006 [Hypoxylon trugodes]KAI1384769.1 hypothetical protein F4822DRAFT_373006 [Hypoxylon trugodes]